MNNRIVIVDGNSLINRAYYAIQRPMITKEGMYTQGIYGFLNIYNRIIEDYNPNYFIVAFDRKAPTFRHKEYDQYKAGRKKMPTELAMQIPVLKELLTNMNVSILEIDGFEADDIIGTVVKVAEDENLNPLVITGDKDELQLASHKTQVMITKKGISDFDIYDHDKMMEVYGLTPNQFIDLKGLMGDSSDNIPGIPGVGEKTALKLLDQFGSIENMLENTDQISKEKLRAKIEENAQLAVMSKRLATIHTGVPIEFDIEDFKVREPDFKRLVPLLVKLEFNSFLKRMKIPEDIEFDSDIILFEEKKVNLKRGNIADLKSDLDDEIVLKVFSDYNHLDLPSIDAILVMNKDTVYYFSKDDLEGLMPILNTVKLIGHDLKQDLYVLMMNNYDFRGKIAFDTAIAEYLLDPTKSSYMLKMMVMQYANKDFESEEEFFDKNRQVDLLTDPMDKYADYGKRWCTYVYGIKKIVEKKIQENDLLDIFNAIELPLIKSLASMEAEGFLVNEKILLDTGDNLGERIDKIQDKIYELSGENFNINSPSQLGVVLFEKIGLTPGKKTKTGYSTGAEVLERIKDEHPVIPEILIYRQLAKLKSTYIEGLLTKIGYDSRIRAHFQQKVTSTGRISCTDPNLQNIPIRQEEGRLIRRAFIAGKDRILVAADYSQIELRVLAHLSGDESLIKDFQQGADIHNRTAARIFAINEDEVTPLQRSKAKAVNFGVIYGQTGYGLSVGLDIPRKEAEIYIAEYFKNHTRVREYMDETIKKAKEKTYVTTMMGRKRDIPEINASNFITRQAGERLAMNTPIQGSAADIIKLAMINVDKRLANSDLKSRLILQVHDELIVETYENELDEIKSLLKKEMENAVVLRVPLIADLNYGYSWFDLK